MSNLPDDCTPQHIEAAWGDSEEIQCSECGEGMDSAERFCPHCGLPQSWTDPASDDFSDYYV